MDFLELAKQRYSVRHFQDRRVEEEKLTHILQAGRVAPTAANCQPQRLLVIQEQEGMDKLGKAANVYGAPLVILVCGDRNKVWKRPFDGKTTLDTDTSIVTDHMMLQATELGLGSVWICYFKPDVIQKEFQLPANWEPAHLLAIGYIQEEKASPDRHGQTRKPLSDTVFFENV